MKTVSTLIILFIFSILSVDAQVPAIQWQKCLGGNLNEYLGEIQKTNDGGFIIAGNTASNDINVIGNHGGIDFLVLKTDSLGNIESQKCYGGSSDDEAKSIKATSDGGYLIAGITYSNDGDVNGLHGNAGAADYWLVKTNADLSIQWTKTYGGSDDDVLEQAEETLDGGFIIAGTSKSVDDDITNPKGAGDCWIVKTNSGGDMVWQKSFGGSNDDGANDILQAPDGGYIFAGSTYSIDGDVTANHGTSDIWVVKLNSSGTMEWQKTFGGSCYENGYSIAGTHDGGYIVSGYSSSLDGDLSANHGFNCGSPSGYDAWIIKLDATGNLQLEKSLGGTLSDQSASAISTSDGGYAVIGSTYSTNGDITFNHGVEDFWVVKFDGNFGIEWQKTYGGSSDEMCFQGQCIHEVANGDYIIGGTSSSVDGDVNGNHANSYDYLLIKLHGATTGVNDMALNSGFSYTIFPNPASSDITISINSEMISLPLKISITDMLGRKVMEEEKVIEGNSISLPLDEKIVNGMYLLTIQSQELSSQKLFEVQH